MGTRIVKLPDIGEGVAEAELIGWLVEVGDMVREDQPLAEVMTDKATVEIPSPAAGTVVALGGEVGGKLAVGSELVRLSVPGEPDEAAPERRAGAEASTRGGRRRRRGDGDGLAPAGAAHGRGARPHGPERLPGEKPTASPAVRKRARDAGIDLREVRGGGPAGRILHEDLDEHLRGRGAARPGRCGARPRHPCGRDQGHRPAPPHRRADGGNDAPDRPLLLRGGGGPDRARGPSRRAQRRRRRAGPGEADPAPLPDAGDCQGGGRLPADERALRRRRAGGPAARRRAHRHRHADPVRAEVPVVRHAETRDLWDARPR